MRDSPKDECTLYLTGMRKKSARVTPPAVFERQVATKRALYDYGMLSVAAPQGNVQGGR